MIEVPFLVSFQRSAMNWGRATVDPVGNMASGLGSQSDFEELWVLGTEVR
jgi:hypothetical protein